MLIISTSRKDHSLAARERAAGEMVFVEHDDSAAMRRLREEAAKYDDADGNCKQKWESFKTIEEAKRRKVEVEYQQELGKLVVPHCNTLDELL